MKKRIMRLAKTIENGEYCIILYFMLMVSNALFWYERDIRNTGIIIALIAFQTLYMYFIGGNTEKEVDKAIRNFLILNIILFVVLTRHQKKNLNIKLAMQNYVSVGIIVKREI